MNIASIIFLAEKIIYYIRIQNYAESCLILSVMLEKIEGSDDLREALQHKDSALWGIIHSMMDALEAKDMILLSDIISDAFIPELKSFIQYIEVYKKGIYSVEATSSGYPTLFCDDSRIYLHSNSNPMEEARVLTNQIYKSEYDEYIVWGCGLGYHIYQLFETAKGAIGITVYDWNSDVFELASEIGILDGIPKDKIKFIVDESGKLFVDRLKEGGTGILIHFPSVLSIRNKQIRDAFHRFFSDWNATVQLERDLEINFRNNQRNIPDCVDDLNKVFEGKDVVLVAGGPSVDDCIEWIRSTSGDKIIVVVARVLKKLVNLGIKPDYVVTLESNKAGYEQIRNIKQNGISMILDSTAYWENATNYKGKKYIAYQRGYKAAEDFAKRNNKRLYDTGGSVITLAFDILLQFKVGRIFLIGADLAYPNGITHALNTDHQRVINTENMEMVRSVSGEMVPTDLTLNKFRKWIEAKIIENPNVEVYNLSKNGAYIKGTKPYIWD